MPSIQEILEGIKKKTTEASQQKIEKPFKEVREVAKKAWEYTQRPIKKAWEYTQRPDVQEKGQKVLGTIFGQPKEIGGEKVISGVVPLGPAVGAVGKGISTGLQAAKTALSQYQKSSWQQKVLKGLGVIGGGYLVESAITKEYPSISPRVGLAYAGYMLGSTPAVLIGTAKGLLHEGKEKISDVKQWLEDTKELPIPTPTVPEGLIDRYRDMLTETQKWGYMTEDEIREWWRRHEKEWLEQYGNYGAANIELPSIGPIGASYGISPSVSVGGTSGGEMMMMLMALLGGGGLGYLLGKRKKKKYKKKKKHRKR